VTEHRSGAREAAVAALRRALSEGDLTCLLCDRAAARPLSYPFSVRFGEATFAGPVRTVDAPGGTLRPIKAALADLPEGAVPLIRAEPFDGACWGGRLAAAAQARGAAGVVVLGRVRDVPTLRAGTLGVVALGVAPHRSEASGSGLVDAPLRLPSGVVAPGDVIVTDENGVAVVPADGLDTVAAELDAWIAAERTADAEAAPAGPGGSA
jgi:regulator of RNase E activity RraA